MSQEKPLCLFATINTYLQKLDILKSFTMLIQTIFVSMKAIINTTSLFVAYDVEIIFLMFYGKPLLSFKP